MFPRAEVDPGKSLFALLDVKIQANSDFYLNFVCLKILFQVIFKVPKSSSHIVLLNEWKRSGHHFYIAGMVFSVLSLL